MKIAIKEIVLVNPRELKPHPHNKKLRKHSKEAIERTALVLEYQGWRYPIIVSNQSGYINVGHKRQMAALLRGWEKVPVSYQDFESDEQEISNVISDNALNEWDPLNLAGVNDLVGVLGPDFDIDLLGLKGFTIDVTDKLGTEDSSYTQKIEAPIYEPKGARPPVNSLTDIGKLKELLKRIDSAEIQDEVKQFLVLAAHRHVVFDYEKIAEFYAHADQGVQILMESSALVIIDFKKAIENGFVNLAEKLSQAYLRDYE